VTRALLDEAQRALPLGPLTVPPAHSLSGELGSVATLAEVERAHVLAAYRAARGNRTLAARLLDISIPTLVRKLRASGVD
jgi:transcriptional regulator of acetoin/glycerol metabolism